MFLFYVQSNLAIRNGLIRNKLVLRNHFLWPICHLLHKDKELLALRNNFRATKKFLIAKFGCIRIIVLFLWQSILILSESEFVSSLDSRYFTLLLTCLALSFLALACAGWGVKSSLPLAWKFMAIFVNAEKSSKNSLPIWCCFFFVLAPISSYFFVFKLRPCRSCL